MAITRGRGVPIFFSVCSFHHSNIFKKNWVTIRIETFSYICKCCIYFDVNCTLFKHLWTFHNYETIFVSSYYQRFHACFQSIKKKIIIIVVVIFYFGNILLRHLRHTTLFSTSTAYGVCVKIAHSCSLKTVRALVAMSYCYGTVSYTHLCLPTRLRTLRFVVPVYTSPHKQGTMYMHCRRERIPCILHLTNYFIFLVGLQMVFTLRRFSSLPIRSVTPWI